MKRIATALALSLAFTSLAPLAAAQEPVSQFRAAEPQAFTQEELQQYGLSSADAAQVAAYQDQGYNVVVMTPEEAQQYQAGITSTQWLLIGLLVVVVVVAVS
jgi:CubicO group peptidase (beta-lactamase class C family)